MKYITLRELCTKCEVTRRAVQGYEQAGLLSYSDKNDRGHLLYNEQAVERVKMIKRFQKYGFSIKEIQECIDAPASLLKNELTKKRNLLLHKQLHLCETINELNELIDSL